MTSNEPPPARVLTSDDRYWAERAAKLDRTALIDLRATAEKWRGGLTGLTAAVTTALAVGTPFIGDAVGDAAVRIWIGVVMALAIIALGTATWLAMLAAFGTPGEIDNSGDALREWTDKAAKRAKRQLSGARWLIVAAFALLLITAGIGLFATSTHAETSRIAFRDKTTYCGTVSFEDRGKTVVVTAADGAVHSRPLVEVVSIETKSDCG